MAAVPIDPMMGTEMEHTETSRFDALFFQAKREHMKEVNALKQEVARLTEELEATVQQPTKESNDKGAARGGVQEDSKRSKGRPSPRVSGPAKSNAAEQAQVNAGLIEDLSNHEGAAPVTPVDGGHLATPDPLATPTEAASSRRGSLSKSGTAKVTTHSHYRGLSSSDYREKARHDELMEKDFLHRLSQSPMFELFFAFCITLNSIIMAAEAQYNGFELAVITGHDTDGEMPDVVWPNASSFFIMANWVFGTLFAIEILIKIAGLRTLFVFDYWNWIDLIIVLLWVYSRAQKLPVNAQLLRLARLARLLRLIRIIKFMKSQSYDSLYLMTTALRGSLSVLTWALTLMLVVHLMLALFFNQLLHEWYFDLDQPENAKEQIDVFIYFGSFSRALLTMFEITLANWPPACRILMENVSEWFIIYAIIHKVVLGFAVVGVVNGVFIQETFKVATMDDVVMVRQAMRRQKVHEEKMTRLFEEADANADGCVEMHEWMEICKDEWVKVWLASQEIPIQDAHTLFQLLDDGDGKLKAEELIKGASRLKGPANSITTMVLLNHVRQLLVLSNPAIQVPEPKLWGEHKLLNWGDKSSDSAPPI